MKITISMLIEREGRTGLNIDPIALPIRMEGKNINIMLKLISRVFFSTGWGFLMFRITSASFAPKRKGKLWDVDYVSE